MLPSLYPSFFTKMVRACAYRCAQECITDIRNQRSFQERLGYIHHIHDFKEAGFDTVAETPRIAVAIYIVSDGNRNYE